MDTPLYETPLAEPLRPAAPTASFTTALVFNINVIMGSGMLAIPYAFYKAGYILGCLVLVVVAFLSYVTICYNFEAQVRAYILADAFCRDLIRFKRPKGAKTISNVESMHTVEGGGASNTSFMGRVASRGGTPRRSPQPQGLESPGRTPPAMDIHVSTASTNPIGASYEDDHQHLLAHDYTHLPAPATAPADGGRFTVSQRPHTMEPPMNVLLEAAKVAAAEHDSYFSVTSLVRINAAAAAGAGLASLNAHDREQFDARRDEDDDGGAPEPDAPLEPYEVDFSQMSIAHLWEINDVLLLFGGKLAVWGWNVSNALFQVCVLWVFLVVVGSTLTLGVPFPGLTHAGECNTNHASFDTNESCQLAIRLWILLVTAIYMALVAQDWKFMPLMQKVFAVVVYVCVGIIVVTVVVAMSTHDYPKDHDQKQAGDKLYVQEIDSFNMAGFAVLFGNCVFAMLCHSATSLILRQMPSARQTKNVFKCAFGGIALLYVGIGMICAFYIGNSIERVATLNWSIYNEWGEHGWKGSVIGSMVLFFPVVSITPGFVLRTRSLTDAVETMIPIRLRHRFTEAVLRADYVASGQGNVYRLQIFIRVVAVLSGLTLSLISYRFEKAVTAAGFCGFTILFLFPLLSQYRSQAMLRHVGIDDATPFDDWTSKLPMILAMSGIAVVAFIYYGLASYVLTG
jgi:amino acid permease